MLTKLTKEQEDRMPEWVEKWVKIGLCTDPADFDAAEKAVLDCYKLIDHPEIPEVLRVGSPHAAIKEGIRREKELKNLPPETDHSLAITQYRCAQMWAGWFARITFFRDVCGMSGEAFDKFALEETIAKSCGFTWWGDKVATISDRPKHIHRDARGRLHSTTQKAIEYPDGWGVYSIHGVIVPDFVITNPEKITAQTIKEERNAEVSRVMIELIGMENFIQQSGLTPVSKDAFGELYHHAEDWYVKVRNSTPEPDGSVKDYFIAINPEHYNGDAGRYPQAAVASTWRTSPAGNELAIKNWKDYAPLAES